MGATIKGQAVTLYGIPNCDQVKKARAWLDAHQVAYTFHDFKKHGLARELSARWLAEVDSGILINRKGTTWRALDDARKALVDKGLGPSTEKIALLLEHPGVIKRPVLDIGGTITVGFAAAQYGMLFP